VDTVERQKSLTKNPCGQLHLDLGLTAFRTGRNKFCCLRHPVSGILLWKPKILDFPEKELCLYVKSVHFSIKIDVLDRFQDGG
jgi:hypothetical protein